MHSMIKSALYWNCNIKNYYVALWNAKFQTVVSRSILVTLLCCGSLLIWLDSLHTIYLSFSNSSSQLSKQNLPASVEVTALLPCVVWPSSFLELSKINSVQSALCFRGNWSVTVDLWGHYYTENFCQKFCQIAAGRQGN